ncbi:MAG TPA: molybdate ABC transporter substrate-binding protein [Gaiellaceae bacterium]|nr:molybdate ABC transporter substrate-binding protein [Gaiellaceae bacterium]
MRRLLLVTALLAALASPAAASAPRLTVFAAASLTDVFPQIDPHERYSFAGSNALAAQIRQGLPADVFASANVTIPDQLYEQGLVERPVLFTANTLVMIARKGNPDHLHGIYSLGGDSGLKIVMAAKGVPVGDYTRTVLAKADLSGVVGRAVSQETDVREVLSKVALGEADVGFVYATDAKAVPGQVAVFAIPRQFQPKVNYAAAAVKAGSHLAAAEAWVRRLKGKAAQRKLRAAGFLVPGRG